MITKPTLARIFYFIYIQAHALLLGIKIKIESVTLN